MYYCCAITDQGVRDHNEDACLIHKTLLSDGMTECYVDEPFLAAVADGVSGEHSGEVASTTCLGLLRSVPFSSRTDMEQRLTEIHRTLCTQGSMQSETRNMQTTLCAIGVDENDVLHTINVGDSRLYRYRGGLLTQLSRDQSLVQILFEEGTITKEQRETHKHRNIIFPVLGNLTSMPVFDIRVQEDRIAFGDVMLLCSDGLSDYASSSEIEEILALPKPLVRRLRLLTELALENGSSDNITIVAMTRIPDTAKR
ncbi:MAG: serine/threonine-protein phosphatase [Oscillospiraceae bacterium]|nr:serine/threonine-protein phosphatase [Oscillospiraceae bacterium]